jgi:hypothetical protein
MRSASRCYKRHNLGAEVIQSMKKGVEVWCEMAAILGVSSSNERVVRYWPAGKDVTRERC